MTTKISHNLVKTPYRKNLIINGAMDIWQRGTSLVMVNGVSKFLADRFQYYNDRSTGAATQLRSTDVPTVAEAGVKFNYSAEIDITTALATPTGTNEATFTYVVEGYDYAKIAGKTATISFWVKSNKTGTYALGFRNKVSASQRRTYTVEYTIDVADTWEKKTVTVPMTGDNGPFGSPEGSDWDYTNGQGLIISWCLMSTVGYATTSTFEEWQDGNTPYTDNQANLFDSTANYFRMTGIQFEKGDVSTEFEFRHVADELALCQRYYQKSYDIGVDPGTASAVGSIQTSWKDTTTASIGGTSVNLPVEMRGTPTGVAYDDAGNSAKISTMGVGATITDNVAYNQFLANSKRVSMRTYNVASVAGIIFHYTLDAEL